MAEKPPTREQIGKLLAGYSAGALSAAELQGLLEAAASDKVMFDSLLSEKTLDDLLADGAARERLIGVLERSPAVLRRRPPFSLKVVLGWSAALAACYFAGFLLWWSNPGVPNRSAQGALTPQMPIAQPTGSALEQNSATLISGSRRPSGLLPQAPSLLPSSQIQPPAALLQPTSPTVPPPSRAPIVSVSVRRRNVAGSFEVVSGESMLRSEDELELLVTSRRSGFLRVVELIPNQPEAVIFAGLVRARAEIPIPPRSKPRTKVDGQISRIVGRFRPAGNPTPTPISRPREESFEMRLRYPPVPR